MNSGVCCSKCFQQINLQSSQAAKLWVDLCEYESYTGKAIILKEKYCGEDLVLLEHLRFIVTTDYNDRILVRINGLHTHIDDEELYCIEVDKHG